MSEKTEALRLADELDGEFVQGRISNHTGRKAATELRRLSAENERFAALVCDYAAEEAPDAIRKIAVDRDRWHTKAQQAEAQRDALLEALKEADDLLRIARDAMWKLGLNGLGSDCRLSHEVRMFALDFSAESRDGPGVLQVNGTGRLQKALASNRAAIKAVEGESK